jgi:hypothetical protein
VAWPARYLRGRGCASRHRHKTIGHNLRQPASARSTYYGVRRLFTLGACDLTSVPEKWSKRTEVRRATDESVRMERVTAVRGADVTR